MPEGTPFTKIDRTEAFGATVLLKGEGLTAAGEAAHALSRERGLSFVHPYDDPAVIAGQGTIALELLADLPDLDTIVVPIGGGGLISGIAIAAKALAPDIEIIGVQAALYPSMYRLMRGEDPGPPAELMTLAEGIAVKEPGRLTRRVVEALVSDILLVDEPAIEDAVEILLEKQRLIVEGAGASGIAAVLAATERFAGKRVAIVVTRRQHRWPVARLDPDARAGARRTPGSPARRIARCARARCRGSRGSSASTPATLSRFTISGYFTTPRSSAPNSTSSSKPRTGGMSNC